ncbi:MAG TPA: hypothetical protein VKG84_11335, partial [Candidatus Acidoferrales bacterium]|nr:hypothetical protein [Candidatus Acidoferrales bacterium]
TEAILNRAPTAPIRLNPDLPPKLEDVINKALEKDRNLRYQSAAEIRADLKRLLRDTGSGRTAVTDATGSASDTTATRAVATQRSGAGKTALVVAAAAALLACAGFGAYKWLTRRPALNLQEMNISRLTQSGKAIDVAISPDGRYVVYVLRDGEKQSLVVRQVATGSDVPILAPDVVNFHGLSFSPDGNYVYFVRTSRETFNYSTLFQMPVLGGAPRQLIRDIDAPVGFSPDGKEFAFIRGVVEKSEIHLLVAEADGSGERVLAELKATLSRGTLLGPAWSPDGKTIVASILTADQGLHWKLLAFPAKGGAPRTLFTSETSLGRPQWLPDGSGLLMGIEDASQGGRGQLWFIAYPSGEARRFTNDLTNYNLCCLDLTHDAKTLVTVENTVLSDLWVYPAGDVLHGRQLTSGEPTGFASGWFPNGTIIYANGIGDLFSIPAEGARPTLLTPNAHNNFASSACGDGHSIVYNVFSGAQISIWRMEADGSSPTQMTHDEGDSGADCSPDGKWFAYAAGLNIYRVPIEGGSPTRLAENNFAGSVAISPDGKLIAYVTRGASITSASVRTIISSGGGAPAYTFTAIAGAGPAQWAPDGRALDYRQTQGGASNIWRQPLAGGAPKQITNFSSGLIFGFSWSRDGKQLAMARGSRTSDIVLIGNFR